MLISYYPSSIEKTSRPRNQTWHPSFGIVFATPSQAIIGQSSSLRLPDRPSPVLSRNFTTSITSHHPLKPPKGFQSSPSASRRSLEDTDVFAALATRPTREQPHIILSKSPKEKHMPSKRPASGVTTSELKQAVSIRTLQDEAEALGREVADLDHVLGEAMQDGVILQQATYKLIDEAITRKFAFVSHLLHGAWNVSHETRKEIVAQLHAIRDRLSAEISRTQANITNVQAEMDRPYNEAKSDVDTSSKVIQDYALEFRHCLTRWNEHVTRFNSSLECIDQDLAGVEQFLLISGKTLDGIILQIRKSRISAIEAAVMTRDQGYLEYKENISIPDTARESRRMISDFMQSEVLSKSQKHSLAVLIQRNAFTEDIIRHECHALRSLMRLREDLAPHPILDRNANTYDMFPKYQMAECRSVIARMELLYSSTAPMPPELQKYLRYIGTLASNFVEGHMLLSTKIADEYANRHRTQTRNPVLARFYLTYRHSSNVVIGAYHVFVLCSHIKSTLERGATGTDSQRNRRSKLQNILWESQTFFLQSFFELKVVIKIIKYLQWELVKTYEAAIGRDYPSNCIGWPYSHSPRRNSALSAQDQASLSSAETKAFKDIRDRLEKIRHSATAKDWVFNPHVWELLKLDLIVQTDGSLPNNSRVTRLDHVLLHEKILSQRTLHQVFASRESRTRLASRLASIVTEITDNRSSPRRDEYMNALELYLELFEGHDIIQSILAGLDKITWAPVEAKDMLKVLTNRIGHMRRPLLVGWEALLDSTLYCQGVDVLCKYHTGWTEIVIKWMRNSQPGGEMIPAMNEEFPPDEDIDELDQSAEDTPLKSLCTLSYQSLAPTDAVFWDYTQHRGPNMERVRVHYCRSLASTERVLKLYFITEKVLGFDMEWKAHASSSGPVKDQISLIQMATESHIGLFHIAQYEGHDKAQLVAPSLKKVMESKAITKAGVNIKGDCSRLRKHLGIDSQGLVELSYLHKLVKYAKDNPAMVNKRPVRLTEQVEEHLSLPLWKGDVRLSNWTRKLKREQVLYAASDPYACLHLFDILESKRKLMTPVPPPPAFAELNRPIILPGGLRVGFQKKGVDEEESLQSSVEEKGVIDIPSSTTPASEETLHSVSASLLDEDGSPITFLRAQVDQSWSNRQKTSFIAAIRLMEDNLVNPQSPGVRWLQYALWQESNVPLPEIHRLLQSRCTKEISLLDVFQGIVSCSSLHDVPMTDASQSRLMEELLCSVPLGIREVTERRALGILRARLKTQRL